MISANGISDAWVCEKCPHGSTCEGNIRWGQVRAKFGYWRVPAVIEREDGTKVDNPSVPDTFEECLFGAACLGYPNTRLAGKYYNLTSGDSLNEESEDLACQTTANDAILNGVTLMCYEYGNPDRVRYRLCQNCR